MINYKYFYFLFIVAFLFSCSDSDKIEEEETPIVNKSANKKNLGDSATDLLSDSKFTSMHIEIVYVNGYAPSKKTLDNFKKFLEARTYKPDGITINLRPVNSSGKSPFDIKEIVEIESENRTIYNAGDEIAVYIYVTDGKSEKDEENNFTLGSAFRNTSMVIFGETIEKFAARPNAPSKSDIETAVFNHEFGHLFGLVDVGTEPQSDHLDKDNAGHCNIEGCLMEASIQFGSGIINEIENELPKLDALCIKDLQAAGGK